MMGRILLRLAMTLIIFPTLALSIGLLLPTSGNGEAQATSFSVTDLVASFLMNRGLWLGAALSLGVGLASHGLGPVWRGIRFAMIGSRATEPGDGVSGTTNGALAAPAEALAIMARTFVFSSLLIAFGEVYSDLSMIRSVLDGDPYPGVPMRGGGMGGAAVLPLHALLIGRIWLAGCADAAFRRSGRYRTSAFGRASDLTSLLFLVPIALHLFLAFYQFPIR